MTHDDGQTVRWLCFACVAAVAACTACDGNRPRWSTVPLDSRFEIGVSIGASAARLVLDTGSQISLIEESSADRLALEADDAHLRELAITDVTGTTVDVRRAVVLDDLRIGDRAVQAWPVPAVSLGSLFHTDGILGCDMLGTATWIFDAPAAQAVMFDRAELATVLVAHGMQIEARVPLTLRDGRPLVVLDLDGAHHIELLVDTGSRGTTLTGPDIEALDLPAGDALVERNRRRAQDALRAELEQAGMRNPVVRITDGPSVGIHGVTADTAPFHLRRLRLGSRTFEDLCVYRTARDHGVLGADVLAQFAWVLDLPNQEMLVLAGR